MMTVRASQLSGTIQNAFVILYRNPQNDARDRKYQSLKGAVGTILRQNEAELKMSKEIDHQTSSTDQAGEVQSV